MKLAIALALIAVFIVAYVVWVRPYLRSLPAFADAWRAEDTVWEAVKVWLDGRKTILTGVWGGLIAWAPELLQIVSGVDLKAMGLPENWALIVGGVFVPVLMLIFRAKASQ